MAQLRPETYAAAREGMKRSAAVVLPLVFHELGTPECVLDVGAGEGWWSRAAFELGATTRVLAVDVAENDPPGGWRTHAWDAEAGEPLPMIPDSWSEMLEKGDRVGGGAWRKWPLALCLEMAEHVSPAAGDHLVSELCRVADSVLWSAALVGQTGDGHVNCQPVEYWAERFAAHGWKLTDPFREIIWNDQRVDCWYRQSLLLAVPGVGESPRTLVHPEIHAWSIR